MSLPCPPLALVTSRFTGSLVGALMGDCHGAPFEFAGRPNVKVVAQHLLRYRRERGVSDGWTDDTAEDAAVSALSFTDDTAMTRSVAASLIGRRGYDAVDMAKRFAGEYQKEPLRGYGYNVTTVFDAIASGKYDEDIYRPAADQFGGSGSYGNGGAMRIAPVALFQFSRLLKRVKSIKESGDGAVAATLSSATLLSLPPLESVLADLPDDICVHSTKLTHSNSLGFHGALLQCVAVKLALRDGLSSSKTAKQLDAGQYLDGLTRAMRNVEEGQDEGRRKKAKVVAEDKDEESDDNSDDDSDDYYENGDDPGSLPYVEKLALIGELLRQVGTPPSSKPNRIGTSDPFRLKPVVKRLGNSVAAHGSVPTAIYCFLRAAVEDDDTKRPPAPKLAENDANSVLNHFLGFDRAILYAICCGGDTDTIASMTGAIAGAYWGVEAVDAALSASCEGLEDARDFARQLAAFSAD